MNEEPNNTENTETITSPVINKDEDLIKKLVEERVASELKDVKGKLDKAYSARDEALKKIAEIEQKEKEIEIKRLQEEGKHKEAYEKMLSEERARVAALEKRNIELTRDIEVRNALSMLEFRNDSAREMAYKEILSQIVQDENGLWKHKSGVSIKDFVDIFRKEDNNSFLFKQKVNTGSGSSTTTSTAPSTEHKSLFSMTQEEVLKLAREGKLPRAT